MTHEQNPAKEREAITTEFAALRRQAERLVKDARVLRGEVEDERTKERLRKAIPFGIDKQELKEPKPPIK